MRKSQKESIQKLVDLLRSGPKTMKALKEKLGKSEKQIYRYFKRVETTGVGIVNRIGDEGYVLREFRHKDFVEKAIEKTVRKLNLDPVRAETARKIIYQFLKNVKYVPSKIYEYKRRHAEKMAIKVIKPWVTEGFWEKAPAIFGDAILEKDYGYVVREGGEIYAQTYPVKHPEYAERLIEHLKSGYPSAYDSWTNIMNLSNELTQATKALAEKVSLELGEVSWVKENMRYVIERLYNRLLAEAEGREDPLFSEWFKIRFDEAGEVYLGAKAMKLAEGKEAEKAKALASTVAGNVVLKSGAKKIAGLKMELSSEVNKFMVFLRDLLASIELGGVLEGKCEDCTKTYMRFINT